MSIEASINMYEQLVAIHEEMLKAMEEKAKVYSSTIPVLKEELKDDRKRLAELKKKGDKQ